MSSTSIKQQLLNYSTIFKFLFFDYYSHQKQYFWLIQLLMVISTLSGMYWLLSIVLGISHYQNPVEVVGLKSMVFSWVFTLPLWVWLIIASAAGMISAWTSYLSITLGVKSVLAYQEDLSKRCLAIVGLDKLNHWTREFPENPRGTLLRILRQGIQLSGLVSRRVARAFVALITFFLALAGLVYLDAKLLLLLLPLAFLYIVALYFINRHAARTSTKAAEILAVTSSRFAKLVNDILNKVTDIESDGFKKDYENSLYMYQAELKYQRRLAEIHVSWLNTIFLVIGVAFIIVYIVYIQQSQIDWQHMLLFLVAMKYAASSLQHISATTVAFSRFLPEIQLVYRLLNVEEITSETNKLVIGENMVVFLPTKRIDDFELSQLNQFVTFNDDALISLISEVRTNGLAKYFRHLKDSKQQHVIIDNNMNRIKKMIKNHDVTLKLSMKTVLLFSNESSAIKKITINEFLSMPDSEAYNESDLELDVYE